MKIVLIASLLINIFLTYFIAKRYYYGKVPPILWTYDIALLGDSHIARANWNELLDYKTANFGKRSTTVKEIYNQVPGVVTCKPKICFVHGGINDIVKQVPADTTLYYYSKIIYDLKRADIKPVIIKVMKLKFPEYDSIIAALNKRIDSLAESIEVEALPDDLQPDGIHMNGSGYAKWTEAIRRYCKNNLP